MHRECRPGRAPFLPSPSVVFDQAAQHDDLAIVGQHVVLDHAVGGVMPAVPVTVDLSTPRSRGRSPS
jgi:hypothetical protein